MVGMLAYFFFHFSTFSYPFSDAHVRQYSAAEYEAFRNGTLTQEPVGCPRDLLGWCASIQPVSFWFYLFNFTFVLAIAFSVTNVNASTLFSKIIGPRPQQQQQALFQASASFARLLGPVLIRRVMGREQDVALQVSSQYGL